MSLYKKAGTPFYGYDFKVAGVRFTGSTGTGNRREAEKVEEQKKAAARGEIDAAKQFGASLRLRDIADSYYDAKGQYLAGEGPSNTRRLLAVVCRHVGDDTLITDIRDADVARMVNERRRCKVPNAERFLTPATVNDTTEMLKKLFTYVRQRGGELPGAPTFKNHWLRVPPRRPRELRDDEAGRLAEAIRDDYAPYFAFLRATGMRATNGRRLHWDQVHWDTAEIRTHDKGKDITDPITPMVRAILWPLRGHDPVHVFTYIARRTHPVHTGPKGEVVEARVAGRRYPLTKEGVKTHWARFRDAAGVVDFRRHDLRHDFATKMLRQPGATLPKVQAALHHSSIETTAIYAHAMPPEVVSGIEQAQAAMGGWCAPAALTEIQKGNEPRGRQKSRTGLRTKGRKSA